MAAPRVQTSLSSWPSCGLGRMVPSRRGRSLITPIGAGHRRMTRCLVPFSPRHTTHRPAKRELSEQSAGIPRWDSSRFGRDIVVTRPGPGSGRRGTGAHLTLSEERSPTATGRSGGRAAWAVLSCHPLGRAPAETLQPPWRRCRCPRCR